MNNSGSVFLTVGNKNQKMLCEKLLSSLKVSKSFDIAVISDDDSGCRLGSGGAVLNILHDHYASGRKLLIINSGGMSKRSVNYALRGKAFANVCREGEVSTLLELILTNAEKLMNCFSSGVLICCSDILVEIDETDINFSDSVGVCIKTDFSTASRHGVMLCSSEGKMLEYLHKRPVSELKQRAAELNTDGMLIDTGISYFSDSLSMALYKLSCDENFNNMLLSRGFEIGLYSDMINLLSKNISREDYLQRETENKNHLRIKQILFDKLSMFSMSVYRAHNQRFLHFGSTKESLDNIFYLSGERHETLSFNSYADATSQIGEKTLLDNVQLNACSIGSGCLITDITLENISVADDKAVCGVKLCDGSFVTIICDVDENPKTINGTKTLWEAPRFYKGVTFTDSLKKYYDNKDEEKYSMEYCMQNADFDYCFSRQQYLRDMYDYTVSARYLKKREEIISHYFSNTNTLKAVQCYKDKVEVQLPLRVNLSGTWTDAMPYCVDNGGQVINMAVKVDGEKPVKVIAEKINGANNIEFCSDGTVVPFSFDKTDNDEDLSDFNLHKAVLKTLGFTSETVVENGFRLTTDVKGIDKGSGLGTSSILLGGCFKALGEMFSINYCNDELIKMVFVAEQIMKTGGGWQDQVGGLIPGLKAGTSVAGIEQSIEVISISLSPFFEKIFSERLVLLPTGQRHFGRFIVNDVVNRYLEGNKESLEGHRKIRELNEELIKSIDEDDYEGFVRCVNTHRELLKLISHKVTNSDIEEIVSSCFEKADAVSYLGAGGGGYLLVVLKEGTAVDGFKDFVKKQFPTITSQVKKIDICYDI